MAVTEDVDAIAWRLLLDKLGLEGINEHVLRAGQLLAEQLWPASLRKVG